MKRLAFAAIASVVLNVAVVAELNTPAHDCALQVDGSVALTFTIPSGTSTRVQLDIGIEDALGAALTIVGTQVTVDPPSYFPDTQTFGIGFYPSDTVNGQKEFNPGFDDDGYVVRLRDNSPGYTLEILNKPIDTGGTWASNESWTVTLAGLGSTDYELSAALTDDSGSAVAAIQFTEVTPCNIKPVAAFNIQPDDLFTPAPVISTSADGLSIYGQSPLPLQFDPDPSDDLDGSVVEYTMNLGLVATDLVFDPSAIQKEAYVDVGSYPVTLQVEDNQGALSDVLTKAVYVMAQERMVFPRHLGVPFDSEPPEIDGTIPGDPGWRGSFQTTFNDGTTDDVVFSGIKHNSANELFLGFEVFENTLDASDRIVIGFRGNSDNRASSAAADLQSDRILIINPLAVLNAQANSVLLRTRDSAGVWSAAAVAPVTVVDPSTNVQVAEIGTGWAVEVQVPTSAVDTWAELDDAMASFFMVISDLGTGTTLRSWPRSAEGIYQALPSIDPATHDFKVAWWGRADKSDGAVSNGLTITRQYIGSAVTPDPSVLDEDNIPPTVTYDGRILYDDPAVTVPNTHRNVLVAKVENDWSRDILQGSPAAIEKEYLPAADVSVTFRIANWGIPSLSSWAPITGNLGNATSNSRPVPAATVTENGSQWFGVEWTLTDAEVGLYDDDLFEVSAGQFVNHQCVLVEINSGSDTDIVTSSTYQNTRFDTASTYSHQAIISALGYDVTPGQTEQKFLLRVNAREWNVAANDPEVEEALEEKPDSRDRTTVDQSGHYATVPYLDQTLAEILDADGRISYVEYTVKGYRFTGGTVTVDGATSEMVAPVGSYGYVISHDGPVEGWEFTLEGPGVEQLDERTYLITIPAETKATVIDTITPLEPPKLRVHANGGIAVPIGTLASTYGMGPNAIAGIGYFVRPTISAHLLFGYNLLPETAGTTNANLMSGSLVGRYHRRLGPTFSVFGAVGGGYYFGDALVAAEFGANVGAGITWRLARWLELEAGADYHYLVTTGSQYLHAHAGLGIRL